MEGFKNDEEFFKKQKADETLAKNSLNPTDRNKSQNWSQSNSGSQMSLVKFQWFKQGWFQFSSKTGETPSDYLFTLYDL